MLARGLKSLVTKCIEPFRDAFENVKKDCWLERRQELDVILSEAFEEDVESCAELRIFLEKQTLRKSLIGHVGQLTNKSLCGMDKISFAAVFITESNALSP